MIIGWTAFIAWLEVSSGEHAGFADIARAVVRGTAPAAPLIPIYALMAISVLDVAGGSVVITARYLSDKFLKPLHEKLREEGREEERRLWVTWNERRLEAEKRGEPFDEPPPAQSNLSANP
jgi:hypothetical protein